MLPRIEFKPFAPLHRAARSAPSLRVSPCSIPPLRRTSHSASARHRSRQRDPRAGDGRRRGGQLRAIPACRWAWPKSRVALWTRHLRHNPAQSALARSRPLRAVERPRLDAAVRAAAPDRLRPADRRAAALPPAAFEDAGPSRKSASRRASRRRPARSARDSPTRSAWRSPSGCSPREFNRPGPRDRRPPHLRVRRRRLPDGRHLARSLLARRHAGARQADRRSTTTTASRSTATSHGWFTDDTPQRFEAYGWHVMPRRRRPRRRRRRRRDRSARKRVTDRPTLICCKTIIGKGAPTKAGTADAHGAALGEKEVAATRAALGWTYPPFEIPADDLRRAGTRASAARALERDWDARFAAYRAAYPGARRRVRAAHRGRAARRLRARRADALVAAQAEKAETIATRKASQQAIEAFAHAAAGTDRRLGRPHRLGVHQLVGQRGRHARRSAGNYINFGVREFAMAAIAQRPRAARRLHPVRRARSSRSPTTRATRCAWRR